MREYLSNYSVNARGELIEAVDFGGEQVEYRINGITEHKVFGIYFSFNSRFETNN